MPWRLCLFLLMTLAATAIVVERIAAGHAFESNVLGLIPQQDESADAHLVSERMQGAMEKRFTLLLSADSEKTAQASAEKLQQAMRDTGIRLDAAAQMQALHAFYFPYRFQLLTPQWRETLGTQSVEQLSQTVLQSLYAGLSDFRVYGISKDPMNFGSAWLQSMQRTNVAMQMTAIPSFVEAGRRWFVLGGELQVSPFEIAAQQQVSDLLTSISSDVDVRRSGLVFHAMYGAELARSEISSVGAGSLLGVLLLVLLAFRSLPALLTMLGLLGFSTLFALAATLLVFDTVHLVTLAFGTTLLGLVADYCFHFFCKWRVSRSSVKAADIISRGLMLGMLSTLLAYTIQLFSPFPGLRQFAIFMIAGLASAGLMVLYILPVLLARLQLPAAGSQVIAGKILQSYATLPANLLMRLLLLAIVLLLVVSVLRLPAEDDIRSLNTSGQHLLDEERFIQQRLYDFETQRYLRLAQSQEEIALQSLEALSARSEIELMHLAKVVPSLARQQADFELVQQKVFGNAGVLPKLCRDSGLFCESMPPQFKALRPADMPSIVTAALGVEALGHNGHYIALPLRSEWQASSMRALAVDGFIYEDNVADLSSLLHSLRQAVQHLMLLFFVLLALLLWFVQRNSSVAILMASLSAITIGLMVAANNGITLFHMLALLLVLGISLDTAIFYARLGVNLDTWTAATLSSATSLLAFGLLALSEVPLLAQFGRVVSCGLGAAWLLSPLMFKVFSDWGENHAGIN